MEVLPRSGARRKEEVQKVSTESPVVGEVGEKLESLGAHREGLDEPVKEGPQSWCWWLCTKP